MPILVTGGAGYIGSHMVWALVDRGEEVVVVDNLTTGFKPNLAPSATLIVGDIGDQVFMERVFREHSISAVVHFAGSIVVPESVADPLGYYANNTVKSRALIAACVNCGVRNFLFSSTAAVYGMPGVAMVEETTSTAPISPYGTSKLMTEYMLADTARAHDFNYVALRYFNVAGADPDGRTGQSSPNATHLIKIATQAALGQRSHMSVFGSDYPTKDGTGVRDYIHVSDLISAHVLAVDHLRSGGESMIANCGYGQGYSVREVISAVKRVSGVDFEVQDAPRRDGDPPALVASSQRVRSQLSWKPEYDDLDTIVSHALAWEARLQGRNEPLL